MPGSVSIRSTGQSASSARSTDMTMNNPDPGNPHPKAPGLSPDTYGSMGSAMEYHETPHPGVTSTGIGSMKCNDAACEQVNKHPAGSKTMGT